MWGLQLYLHKMEDLFPISVRILDLKNAAKSTYDNEVIDIFMAISRTIGVNLDIKQPSENEGFLTKLNILG